MPWLQLIIHSDDKDFAEQISEVLADTSAAAVTMQDAADQAVLEPPPGTTPLWGKTKIIGLYDDQIDLSHIVSELEAQFERPLAYKIEPLEEKDWQREWLQYFKPICFAERLWIIPSNNEVIDDSAINVFLDPGLAFGTGTHPTTKLCLDWIGGQDLSGKSVIDYGCGSGILAICALKCGAKSALGIDIDPQALIASRDNANKNHIAEADFDLAYPEQTAVQQFDCLVANILAKPLVELASQLQSFVKPGGDLVLSGILQEQADDVLAAYQTWFTDLQVKTQEDWVMIHGVRAA